MGDKGTVMSISRIYRLLKLITMLQTRRDYTADELARELEVSRRTVFRDLNMLEMAHIPYFFDAERGGYRISKHFFLPPINLTIAEALAVLMLTGRLRGGRQLPLISHGAKAAMKVESALPASIRNHVGSVIERLHLDFARAPRHEGLDAMFDDLTVAIAQKRTCKMVYISFHDQKQITTTVRPLHLVFMSRAWYVLAYAAKFREVRTFKLGRIRKLTVTDKTFTEPQAVDVEDHFGQAWQMIPEGTLYDVHVHFAPKVAANVAEVNWHGSQRVEWNDDGSVEFHATVDGLGEITWWILGYGDQAEVVAPPALRRRIADAATAVTAKYRKSNRGRS